MSMLMQLLLDWWTKEPLSISRCTGVIMWECTGLLRCTDVKNAGVWVYWYLVYRFMRCTDVNFLGVWVFGILVYGGFWWCTGLQFEDVQVFVCVCVPLCLHLWLQKQKTKSTTFFLRWFVLFNYKKKLYHCFCFFTLGARNYLTLMPDIPQ